MDESEKNPKIQGQVVPKNTNTSGSRHTDTSTFIKIKPLMSSDHRCVFRVVVQMEGEPLPKSQTWITLLC